MNLNTIRIVLVAGVLLPGCGDDGASASGDGTGSGTATDGSATQSSTSADGSGTGPLSCEDYESTDQIGPEVTLSVRHTGTTPVFIRPVGCGGAFPLAILTEGSGDSIRWRTGECFPTICDDFLSEVDCSEGCPNCEGPPAGRIEPGGEGTATWSGVSLVGLEMSADCAPGTNCQRECLRRDQAADGNYVVELAAFQTCAGPCDCTEPAQNGVCQIWEYEAMLSDPVTFSAVLSYPAETTVEVVVDI